MIPQRYANPEFLLFIVGSSVGANVLIAAIVHFDIPHIATFLLGGVFLLSVDRLADRLIDRVVARHERKGLIEETEP